MSVHVIYKAYSTSKLDQIIFTCVHEDKKGTGTKSMVRILCFMSPHLDRATETAKYSSQMTSSGGHKRTTDYERETRPPPPPTPSEAGKATAPVTADPRLFCLCVCVFVCCYLTALVCLDEGGDVAVSRGSLYGSPVLPSNPS